MSFQERYCAQRTANECSVSFKPSRRKFANLTCAVVREKNLSSLRELQVFRVLRFKVRTFVSANFRRTEQQVLCKPDSLNNKTSRHENVAPRRRCCVFGVSVDNHCGRYIQSESSGGTDTDGSDKRECSIQSEQGYEILLASIFSSVPFVLTGGVSRQLTKSIGSVSESITNKTNVQLDQSKGSVRSQKLRLQGFVLRGISNCELPKGDIQFVNK